MAPVTERGEPGDRVRGFWRWSMFRIEGAQRGVRIIGSLKGALLRNLLETLSEGQVMLDLSEVREADDSAVDMLARLPARCRLVNSPRWLALWIEQERRPQTPPGAPGVRREP